MTMAKTMTKKELLEWYYSIPQRALLTYREADDVNINQLCLNGEWQNDLYAWVLCFDGQKWKYAETDDERGYVCHLKTFETESAAVEYIKKDFRITYLGTRCKSEIGAIQELLYRFVQKEFGYPEERAVAIVDQIAKHTDVLEEFFNYAWMGDFCKEDKPKNQVCGYTAEILTKEYNLSPLEVYSYLVYFIEDPERAEADLKAGLPPKALSEI
jgi:hypothetical protein